MLFTLWHRNGRCCLLGFVCLLCASLAYGQVTLIPDVAFEQKLIDLGIDSDVSLNGQMLTADASGVTVLNVSSSGISDLTGIEAFTDLIALDCKHNTLTSLNIASNTNVINLNCFDNALTSLDVSNNLNLEVLQCQVNPLGTLDVSNNTALIDLRCNATGLTSLDVSNNTALVVFTCGDNALSSLDVSNNTLLQVLDCRSSTLSSLDVSNNVDLISLNCFNNALSSLDVSNNFNLEVLQCQVNPLGTLDVSNNTALTDLRCNATGLTSLDVSNNTALVVFTCGDNTLSSLDVSNNTLLQVLNCKANNLSSLDISTNVDLIDLNCFNNVITGLDVSNNLGLEVLQCQVNPLGALDVTNNTSLVDLRCSFNGLTNLDVSNNGSLIILACGDNALTNLDVRNGNNINFVVFNALNNPDLTCIAVDDAAFATSSPIFNSNIDPGVIFSEDCDINSPPDCSMASITDQPADANCQATISNMDVTGVTDPDNDPLTITVDPVNLDLGANIVTITADDGNGGGCTTDITVYVTDTDTDNDGTVDCEDGCPFDPDKAEPGICGCGFSDNEDNDGDAIPNSCDNCIEVSNTDQTDSDADGIGDACDACPDDADHGDYNNDGFPDCVNCGSGKILICHVPPGNPCNEKQLCINSNAADAHLDNGSGHAGCYVGVCHSIYCPQLTSAPTHSTVPSASHDDLWFLNASVDDDASAGKDHQEMILAYPNPSNGIITITNRLFDEGMVDITVTNITGEAVYQKRVPAAVKTDLSLLDRSIPNGIYVVSVSQREQIVHQRIVLDMR